jgi:hypothetical protein
MTKDFWQPVREKYEERYFLISCNRKSQIFQPLSKQITSIRQIISSERERERDFCRINEQGQSGLTEGSSV